MNATRFAAPGPVALIQAILLHEILQFDTVNNLSRNTLTPRLSRYSKTLIIALPRELAIAILSAPSRLSLKETAAAPGVTKANTAEPAAAQRATSYVVGGVFPSGQWKRLRTVVDTSALSWDRVLCNAGKRHRLLAPGCRGEPGYVRHPSGWRSAERCW